MANEQQYIKTGSWSDWIKQIAGTLVVAAIIGAFTLGGSAWINLIRYDDRIFELEKQAGEGKRFTKEEGIAFNTRIKLLEASRVGHEERLDNHVNLQEHQGADRRLKTLNLRLNAASKLIFDHTKGTSGRIYQLNNLERRVEKLEKDIEK